MAECVFNALRHCLIDTEIDTLKRDFKYGKKTFDNGEPIPPSVHEIIDYFMGMGGALVPISRCPQSEHGGRVYYDLSPEDELDRWYNYVRNYNGFLVGHREGVGHMAWLERGTVYDGDRTYHVSECGPAFYPETFLVLLWQA